MDEAPSAYRSCHCGILVCALEIDWSSGTFDLAVGTALLVALMPLLVILMVAQVLSCGRPMLFRQSRVTRAGRIVSIIKLRTLSCADPDSEWSAPADSCSPVGRWLRSNPPGRAAAIVQRDPR